MQLNMQTIKFQLILHFLKVLFYNFADGIITNSNKSKQFEKRLFLVIKLNDTQSLSKK